MRSPVGSDAAPAFDTGEATDAGAAAIDAGAAAFDARATLDAWRQRGDHRHDPVRFRFIEALARRAQAHGGAARRLLDDRLAALLAAYDDALDKARCADPDPASEKKPTGSPAPRSALAELVDHLAREASAQGIGTAGPGSEAGSGAGSEAKDGAPGRPASPAPELKTLRYFRSTWSRLSADRLLTQSRKKVPQNAGPLNSQHLVHQSLTLMRELSPEYFHRFIAYVDALSWVDRVNGTSASAGAEAPRAANDRKPARSRP
jgi:hypothetical protein